MHVGALSRFASKLPGLDERRDHALRTPVDLGENAPFRLLTFKNGDDQRVALNFMKLPRIRLYFHLITPQKDSLEWGVGNKDVTFPIPHSPLPTPHSPLPIPHGLFNPRPVFNRHAGLALL